MKMKLIILIIIIMTVNALQAAWPNTRGILGVARNIARRKDLPAHDLTVGKAIKPGFPADPVLIFSNTDKLELLANPGVNGKFKLTIAHLAGGSYAPISVFVDDILIGKSKTVEGKIQSLVSTFKTPMLPSHGVNLKLQMENKGSIGIIYIDWKNFAFEQVPANVWKTTVIKDYQDYTSPLDGDEKGKIGIPGQIDGQKCAWKKGEGKLVDMSYGSKGTAVAVTHFFRSTCWAALSVRFTVGNDAIVTFNGETKQLKADKTTEFIVKGHKMLSGLNRVIVRMPADDQATFKMFINPNAGKFLDKVPGIINPKLNVDNWPKVKITNGKVSATIALPDPVKGFYRGVRFDHSSMVPELTFNGHSYFGINARKTRNPVANDQAAGVAEEFFEPIGFDEAKVGETFMKIGVGLLERPYATKYFFGTNYWPIKFFDWTVKTSRNQVELKQVVNESGYGYDYTKKITVPDGKNALVIEYTFKNTGRKQITTNQYAHNFIQIDNKPIGPDYTVKFKGKVRPLRSLPDKVKFSNGNTFSMYDKTLFSPISGFKSVNDNWVDVFLPDKTGIRITGDFVPFIPGSKLDVSQLTKFIRHQVLGKELIAGIFISMTTSHFKGNALAQANHIDGFAGCRKTIGYIAITRSNDNFFRPLCGKTHTPGTGYPQDMLASREWQVRHLSRDTFLWNRVSRI